jgi:uncharacterized membrane protein YraQ (UPF0718 family)/copper chaperone CopZ
MDEVAAFSMNLIKAIVITFLQMAPYLLLGLTFAGILHVLFKKEFIVRHLGKNDFMSSVKAALLGVPLPLCSCGVIPTALSLRKSNASEGATVSFLISTPQTGVDSIIATYGMLGPVFAVFRPIAAFIMGIAGGFITTLFPGPRSAENQRQSLSADCPICLTSSPHIHTIREKLAGMARYAYGEFLDDISAQLFVGMIISAIIAVVIPPDFFERYVGNTLVEMVIMVIGGIPLYVCATASIPIAMALMMKGLSPGAAFVFLACGPATNAASIILIANVMGKRVVAIYLSVIALFSMAAGFVLNEVYKVSTISPMQHMHHHGGHESIDSVTVVLSLLFLGMLGASYMRKYTPKLWGRMMHILSKSAAQETGFDERTLRIDGMTCNHCARHVTEALQHVEGVTGVNVDLGAKTARIRGRSDPEKLRSAVTEAGYRIVD